MAAVNLNSSVPQKRNQRLTIVSYNLHGLNQGSVGLQELVCKLNPDVLMVQEHWLTPDNLFKLDNISSNYTVFGSSAMNERICSGPLYGRPFGGTAILVNNLHISATKCVISADRYTAIKIDKSLLITVYMPCAQTPQRDLIYVDLLAELEALFISHSNCQFIIAGDFNTDLNCNSFASRTVNKFIVDNCLSRCDNIFPLANNVTYYNESTHCSSTIDYILTSHIDDVVAFNILDLDINLSDHFPIMAVCSSNIDSHVVSNNCSDNPDIEHFRWDHAPLDIYYEQTRIALQPIFDNIINFETNLHSYDSSTQRCTINHHYEEFVNALCTCANICIPKHKKNFFKFWWSQELDELKSKAISSCRAWKAAGKPKHGAIFDVYKKDKASYKKCIRDEQAREKLCYTNDLHEGLLHKNGRDFWKIWNSKFERKSNNINQISGIADDVSIANGFARHFECNCQPFDNERNSALKADYAARRAEYCGSSLPTYSLADVEIVDSIIREMKSGRAAGLDGLQLEHLKHSHPVAVSILSKLFSLFITLGYVPTSFGLSYTVPIPKCDGRTRSLSFDDFRGISISPIVSKIFEKVIFKRFSDYFVTSDHQFGFKPNVSCTDAIYCVRNVIESFISNGSTVNVCTLDLSKAFDRMNHFALFSKLMDRKIPVELLSIFEIWFVISVTCVKWKNVYSCQFILVVGVRQGGVLSPILFAIFIDSIVCTVKNTNVGCYISSVFCSIFLYADDILLVAPTVTALQLMLDACETELRYLDMRVNVKKSACIRFGSRYAAQCSVITSSFGGPISWVESCRYLGVFFVSGKTFKCCFNNAKCRFFRAFNSIFSKVGRLASQEVVISLVRSKCIPVLLYATEACPLLSRQKHSLEFTINRLFMKLFSTASPHIVENCLYYFNFLPIIDQICIRTARFLQRFIATENQFCYLFNATATNQLQSIFSNFGPNINTACQLKNRIFELFDIQFNTDNIN